MIAGRRPWTTTPDADPWVELAGAILHRAGLDLRAPKPPGKAQRLQWERDKRNSLWLLQPQRKYLIEPIAAMLDCSPKELCQAVKRGRPKP